MATKTHITKQEEGQTEKSVQMRSTDPGSPVTNQLWANTTERTLKFFDGTVTRVIGTAGGGTSNYYGDDSDGAGSISVNTQFVTQNKNGPYDADMIVKNYTSLTIDSAATVTPDQPCRGMLIYVSGDCVINGTLSMSGFGALRNPTDVSATGLRFIRKTATGTSSLSNSDIAGSGVASTTAEANQASISGDGDIFVIEKVGGAGGSGATAGPGTGAKGSNGVNGTVGQSGGGGGGGTEVSDFSTSAGSGAAGTCFGGGSGGGARASSTGTTVEINDGVAFCGAGGAGGGANTGSPAGGGAGNPGGAGVGGASAGGSGVGGLLVLIVKGNLTIGPTGSIEANGQNGGNSNTTANWNAGGGASGGGNVLILHAGTYTNNGTVSAAGGAGGVAGANAVSGDSSGGDGGAGSIQVAQILI